MTDFAFLGVFGEGRFLNANSFASGMESFPCVHIIPRNSIVDLFRLIFCGLILI